MGMYVHSVVYTYDIVSSYLRLDLQQQSVVVFVHRNLFHDKFEKGLYKSGAVFIVCTFSGLYGMIKRYGSILELIRYAYIVRNIFCNLLNTSTKNIILKTILSLGRRISYFTNSSPKMICDE